MSMKRMSLMMLLAVIACSALHGQRVINPVAAQRAVDAVALDPELAHASLGIAVTDLRSGRMIAASQPELSCITASTMKAVTSATALELLGPEYTFTTPVTLHGAVKGSSFKGQLVITGVGDPTLGSVYFPANPDIVAQIVDALRSRGITKVEGRIVADNSLMPYPPFVGGWDADDLGSSYGMGIHGLNYRDNRTRLTCTMAGGELASWSASPAVPGVQLIDRTDGTKGTPWVLLEYANPAWVLSGGSADTTFTAMVANPTPAAMLADSLQRALAAAGIDYKPTKHDGLARLKPGEVAAERIVEHQSPLLCDIVASLLDRSDNMMTEGVLRAIARHSGRTATARQGAAVVDSLWRAKGLDVEALFQTDGSGLARANKASAHFMTDMLRYEAGRSWQLADGRTVSLASLMSRAQGRVGSGLKDTPLAQEIALKTGSMTQVQCFVGYWPAHDPQYSWAVLANNWNCSRNQLKDKIAAMLLSIFGPDN